MKASPLLTEITRQILAKDLDGNFESSLTEKLLDEAYSHARKTVFLNTHAEAGGKVSLYGKIVVGRSEKGWNWARPILEEATALKARPRSSLPPDAIIIGSSEEAAFFDAFQQRLTKVEADAANQEESKQRAAAARLKQFLSLLGQDVVFRGTATAGEQTEIIQFQIIELDLKAMTIAARLRIRSVPGQFREFSGSINPLAAEDQETPFLRLTAAKPHEMDASLSNVATALFVIGSPLPTLILSATDRGLEAECSEYVAPKIKLTKQ